MQNTGTVSLFLLPAVFLHFFLIFPRPKQFHFAQVDEWTREQPPRWKTWLQNFLSASPGLLYLIYAVPPIVFLYDVFRQLRGDKVSVLWGAPLSSWALLGDYLILGLALAGALRLHASRRARTPAGVPRLRRHDSRHAAVLFLLGIVLPSAFNTDEYVFYGIVPMILIPLTFAYAIVRFQMLNIRFVVRRTFLYAVTTAILFGFYAVAIAGSRCALRPVAPRFPSPAFNFGFFLVVLPLFEFVRRRIQTPLDKLFFRDKLDYQSALARDERSHHGRARPGKIADYLTASVAGTMRLEKASIWLRDVDGVARAPRPAGGPGSPFGDRCGGSSARRASPCGVEDLSGVLRGPGQRGLPGRVSSRRASGWSFPSSTATG